MHDLVKIIQSVRYASRGVHHAYRSDKSFRMEVHYGLPIYLLLAWYLAPFQPWEILLYTFSYFLILIVELVNTAFEKMLDRVHPEKHEAIAHSKDIASAAVLLAFVFAGIVVFVLLLSRLTETIDVNVGRTFV